jgi:hypothetical protein
MFAICTINTTSSSPALSPAQHKCALHKCYTLRSKSIIAVSALIAIRRMFLLALFQWSQFLIQNLASLQQLRLRVHDTVTNVPRAVQH